jgi:hypothetical protein
LDSKKIDKETELVLNKIYETAYDFGLEGKEDECIEFINQNLKFKKLAEHAYKEGYDMFQRAERYRQKFSLEERISHTYFGTKKANKGNKNDN